MRLTPHAMQIWGFRRDPFADNPRSYGELFWSAEMARFRDFLLASIAANDAVAVSAPVGSGKTIVWQAIKEQLADDASIGYLVTEPIALAKHMIDANCIQRAILEDLDVVPRNGTNSESLTRAVVRVVTRLAAKRKRIVVCIDEAHRISDSGYRALKNLLDILVGYQRVMSIVLLGQEELIALFGRESMREVAARFQLVRPGPLSIEDGEVKAYIRHRIYIARAGRPPADAADRDGIDIPFTADGLAAVELECSGHIGDEEDVPSIHGRTLIRPDYLVINAICSHALSEAADLGVPAVTADVVHKARSAMRAGV